MYDDIPIYSELIMPLKLGTVYRITCDVADVAYVGSTMRSIEKRLREHISDSRAWAAGKSRKYCAIFPHMLEHGAQHFKIEAIKQYRVADGRHLRVFETLWIKMTPHVCNHNEPFQIKRLWQRRNYQSNREQILEQQRQNYQSNRERVREQQRARYQANREQILKCHECECGGHYSQSSHSRHMHTKKHQRWAAEQ